VTKNPVYALICIRSQIYVLSAKSWYISRFPGALVLMYKSYIYHFRIDSVTPDAARQNWHRSPSRLLNTLAPCVSPGLELVTRDNLKGRKSLAELQNNVQQAICIVVDVRADKFEKVLVV